MSKVKKMRPPALASGRHHKLGAASRGLYIHFTLHTVLQVQPRLSNQYFFSRVYPQCCTFKRYIDHEGPL